MRKTHFIPLILCTLLLLSACTASETVPTSSNTVLPDTEILSAESVIPSIPEQSAAESTQADETEHEPEEETEEETEYIPTADELLDTAVNNILEKMTPEEKLGQMFLCANEARRSADETMPLGFSGYLYFDYDFVGETPESIADYISTLQSESEYGLLFAIDEEGGTVVRASKYPEFRTTPFDSPRNIYASSGAEGIYTDALDKGQHLASLGFNFNLAPVADIATDPSSFIYDRSIGISGSELSEALLSAVKGHRESGVASCVKHFPGYGSAADTHKMMAWDRRPLEEIEAYDLVPFYTLCDDGVEAVMVSHIIVDAIDSTRPASVSSKAVEYIRNSMGYDGIIMTDDLAMTGILEFCSTGNAALEAVTAGFDLLCCTNWESQYPAVLEAVQNGTIPEERLNESVSRILRLKNQLGLWDIADHLE